MNVLPPAPAAKAAAPKIAVYDPKGETIKLLEGLGLKCQRFESGADLSGYDMLVIGKAALTAHRPRPKPQAVTKGLKVIVFEQTSDTLEKRFGFRVNEYGLRNVFQRVPDHPALAGLELDNLHDWRGEATILPARLKYEISKQFGTPTVEWAGIPVTRVWRCGNRGNVASVLIEKPARGNFLPIIDGGYSLQYSPLMEYREGKGMVLFCQMDVTGRTESDPAAERLVQNMIQYVATWQPAASRQAVYAGDAAGKNHLEKAGISVAPYNGGARPPARCSSPGPAQGKRFRPTPPPWTSGSRRADICWPSASTSPTSPRCCPTSR